MSKKVRKQQKSSGKGLAGDANSGVMMIFPDGKWVLIASVYMPHPGEPRNVFFELRRDLSELHGTRESYVKRVNELLAGIDRGQLST